MATQEQIKALKIAENVWNWERIQNRTSNVSKGSLQPVEQAPSSLFERETVIIIISVLASFSSSASVF